MRTHKLLSQFLTIIGGFHVGENYRVRLGDSGTAMRRTQVFSFPVEGLIHSSTPMPAGQYK